MTISSRRAFRASAILGFLGVALGAFGAHGLKDVFARHAGTQDWWETAVLYQFVHVGVMLLLACLLPFRGKSWVLFGVGILLFSGSLYLTALARVFDFAIHGLWIVTPLGGACLLAAWLSLLFDRRDPVA